VDEVAPSLNALEQSYLLSGRDFSATGCAAAYLVRLYAPQVTGVFVECAVSASALKFRLYRM
jgi:hypothetical protein